MCCGRVKRAENQNKKSTDRTSLSQTSDVQPACSMESFPALWAVQATCTVVTWAASEDRGPRSRKSEPRGPGTCILMSSPW